MTVAQSELAIDAIKSALDTALGGLSIPTSAYDLDDLPVSRPPEYVEVTLSRRYGGLTRPDGYRSVTLYRLTARAVSRTSVTNARIMLDRVRGALEFNTFTVGSLISTPVEFETEEPVGSDDGWWSGLTTWTFAL